MLSRNVTPYPAVPPYAASTLFGVGHGRSTSLFLPNMPSDQDGDEMRSELLLIAASILVVIAVLWCDLSIHQAIRSALIARGMPDSNRGVAEAFL